MPPITRVTSYFAPGCSFATFRPLSEKGRMDVKQWVTLEKEWKYNIGLKEQVLEERVEGGKDKNEKIDGEK
jgi:hypothetical protein